MQRIFAFVSGSFRNDEISTRGSLESRERLHRRSLSSVAASKVEEEPFHPEHRVLPILSGLICPFSVLLEIPGLTERWYVKLDDAGSILHARANPPVLLAGLSFALLLGVLANISLITRFCECRPRHSTLAAITFLSVHDIINIAVVIAYGITIEEGYTYGEPFYMTVASTIASTTCNILLVYDFLNSDFSRDGSGLSLKQRSLVISVVFLCLYMSLGALVFTFLLSLSFIDALYFVVETITSVGLGDYYPSNLSSQLFSIPFDLVGLLLVGFCIAVGRESIVEGFQSTFRRRRRLLAIRRKEHIARRRERLHKRQERHAQFLQGSTTAISNAQSRALDFCEETQDRGLSTPRAKIRRFLRKLGVMSKLSEEVDPSLSLERSLTAQSELEEHRFTDFKTALEREQRQEFQVKITISLSLFFLFWSVGAAVFTATEGWNYFESLTFCWDVITTIGYGYISPSSLAGKSFYIVWSLLGIAVMTILLSVLTESWSTLFKTVVTKSKTTPNITATSFTAPPNSSDNLPRALLDSAKGFMLHARWFLRKDEGNIPQELREASLDDSDLEGFKQLGNSANLDRDHYMFMISFERRFESLVAMAESSVDIFAEHAAELETLRELNATLRRQVQSQDGSLTDSMQEKQEDVRSKSPNGRGIFLSQSPGGDDEVAAERALCADQDQDSTDDEGVPDSSAVLLRRAVAALDTFSRSGAERNTRVMNRQYDSDAPNLTRRLSRAVVDIAVPDSVAIADPPLRSRPDSDAVLPMASRMPTLTFADAPRLNRD